MCNPADPLLCQVLMWQAKARQYAQFTLIGCFCLPQARDIKIFLAPEDPKMPIHTIVIACGWNVIADCSAGVAVGRTNRLRRSVDLLWLIGKPTRDVAGVTIEKRKPQTARAGREQGSAASTSLVRRHSSYLPRCS